MFGYERRIIYIIKVIYGLVTTRKVFLEAKYFISYNLTLMRYMISMRAMDKHKMVSNSKWVLQCKKVMRLVENAEYKQLELTLL